MPTPWEEVRCVSIPEGALSALADLRREAAAHVTIARGRAWVAWDDPGGPDGARRILVERLLPIAGAQVFTRRDGRWHRPGDALPAFDVPIGDPPGGVRLDRAVVPAPTAIVPPGRDVPRPVPLRLVRDDREIPRPTTAVRCSLSRLASWADRAPSSWIAALSGAWCPGDAPEVLLLGPTNRLPAPEDALRFWGDEVLIPLGRRPEPDLGERALKEAVGAGRDDLVVLDHSGLELIPRRAFGPMSRARIRLATGPAAGGARP